jgi:hypothetical protein
MKKRSNEIRTNEKTAKTRNEETENEEKKKTLVGLGFYIERKRRKFPYIQYTGIRKGKFDLPESSKPKVFAGARDRLSMHFPYNRSNGAFCIKKRVFLYMHYTIGKISVAALCIKRPDFVHAHYA